MGLALAPGVPIEAPSQRGGHRALFKVAGYVRGASERIGMHRMTPDSAALAAALSRLDELTNWEATPRATMRQELHAMRTLTSLCGNPQAAMRFVHVTGTKGKGSVCSLVEQALVAAGLKVGRYSSPHLTSVMERISIGGRPIEEGTLASLISRVVERIEEARIAGGAAAHATWFDAMTAAAFMAFQAAGCEWVVLEVGLGGRFDSTNVVAAEIAVITNVELEHTEVLGRTRSAIAHQKAGIIKRGATVVTPLHAADEAGHVVHAEALAMGARVRTVVPDPPTMAALNLAIAGAVLDEIGQIGVEGAGSGRNVGAWLLTDEVVRASALPGRMEYFRCHVEEGRLEHAVDVVLDGAHVPFNLEAVLLDVTLESACIAVFAVGQDKDIAGLLAALSSRVRLLIITTLPGSVTMADPSQIASIAEPYVLDVRIIPCPEAALHQSLEEASRLGIWVLVTGSLRLAGFLRPLLVNRCVSGKNRRSSVAEMTSGSVDPV